MSEEIVNEFYERYYDQVFSKPGSVSSSAYRRTHVALEKSLNKANFPSVLEIGAGKGEHLPYVRHSYDRYFMVDLYEQPKDLVLDNQRHKWISGDINEMDFSAESFDRILMMCVLHHLNDPYDTLKKIDFWLKPGGFFTLFLPSDPGILNRISRKMFVTPRAKLFGFMDYELVNALEHKNHVYSLRIYLDSIMKNYQKKTRYYPINFAIPNLTLFSIWKLQKPIK